MNLFRWLFMLLAFPAFAFAADCQSVGPSRSITPEYFISCIYLADSATGTGARATCTAQVLENVDEWYFFVTEDEALTDLVADIENFFEPDDDPVVIGQLTDENPEFRWIRATMGNLHKSLRVNITTATGPPTDLDIQMCFVRYIHQ